MTAVETTKPKSKRGGYRPNSGRPKGSKDRSTIEQRATIEELARSYSRVAINALVSVATKSDSDSARVAAANALLDRGYGKPKQGMELSGMVETVTAISFSDHDLAKLITFQLTRGARSTAANDTESEPIKKPRARRA